MEGLFGEVPAARMVGVTVGSLNSLMPIITAARKPLMLTLRNTMVSLAVRLNEVVLLGASLQLVVAVAPVVAFKALVPDAKPAPQFGVGTAPVELPLPMMTPAKAAPAPTFQTLCTSL